MGLLGKIFGTQNDREVKRVKVIADKVEALAEKYAAMTDLELKACTPQLKDRYEAGESLDALLPDAYALVREASTRVLKMRHYPVQIIGGVVLHQGRIAEMATGEGKTLVATLPCYLNALTGKGVHVVTVNDYLAKRDAEWMGKVYRFLGMTVGVIVPGMMPRNKKAAYDCDITYCTNNELGFDYLRDNMQKQKENKVQRELNFAIVDEVDSILIDEARTPLIISQNPDTSEDKIFKKANSFVRTLNKDDYELDEKDKQISLSDTGVAKAEKYYNVSNLGDTENVDTFDHINTALRANYLMTKDVDYVVVDKEIIIVDEFTGRLMIGRRYRDGLHQAIEVKEGLPTRSDSKTVASITFQNLFRLYKKLSGMTGTAKTEETEFRGIYYLDVVTIPTNKPVIRIDERDHLYKTKAGKYRAILNEIKEAYKNKRPVLVGTISVEKSVEMSALLDRERIPHNILNAKNHEKEAYVIAQAGRLGQITIATNMAGRGTDIMLGGNPDYITRKKMQEKPYNYSEDIVNMAVSPVDNMYEDIVFRHNEFEKVHEIMTSLEGDTLKEILDKIGGASNKASQRVSSHYAIALMVARMNFTLEEIHRAWFPEYDESGAMTLNHHGVDPYYLRAKFIMVNHLGYDDDYIEKIRYAKKSRLMEIDGEGGKSVLDKQLYEKLYEEGKTRGRVFEMYRRVYPVCTRQTNCELYLQNFAKENGFSGNIDFRDKNQEGVSLEDCIRGNAEYYAIFDVLAHYPVITDVETLKLVISDDIKNLPEQLQEMQSAYKKVLQLYKEAATAREVYKELFEETKKVTDAERQEVIAKGGLYIIGTERHDSRRIDNQLRGRAGRQGDPGQSTFYISTEDDLCRVFGGDRLYSILNRFNIDEDVPISVSMITNAIERAQLSIEDKHYSMRKNVLSYDEVLNKQREVIYKDRNEVLSGEDVHEKILGYIPDVVREIISPYTDRKVDYYAWDYKKMNEDLEKVLLPYGSDFAEAEYAKGFDVDNLVRVIAEKAIEEYEKFIAYFDINIEAYKELMKNPGLKSFDDIERVELLSIVDKNWMQQLDDMDALRQGIGLRAYGQKDPKIAYAQEGYDLFEQMIDSIKRETVHRVFKYTKISVQQKVQTKVVIKRTVGRNELCPCGSGKKYKNCCGK